MEPTAEQLLADAAKKLVDAAKKGEWADYRAQDAAENDPAKGARWDERRTINAETIYQLVTRSNPAGSLHAKGVQIEGARIKGLLDFASAEIKCPLALIGCYLDEDITLTYASARSISLTGTQVLGIEADGLTVDGGMFLDQSFNAKGDVSLVNAKIDGAIVCTRGTFENGLSADFLKVGSVFLDEGFNAKGVVSLVGATIDGQLQSGGGTFEAGLIADGLKVGSVFLDEGFHAKGEVSLVGAEIDGQLVCKGGTFEKGLVADSLRVSQVSLKEGFNAKGVVSLVGAKIDGALVCSGGTFEKGLVADTLKVGSVFFDQDFNAKGEVSLVGAEIGDELNCCGGTFEGNLDLTRAHAGALADDPNSWPKPPGKLLLDGFEYSISSQSGVPRDAKRRLKWIKLGPDAPFLPQPYEQLVKVLHAMGDEAGARKVSIRERWMLRRRGKLGFAAWLWNWILCVTVGYGYLAWLPLLWAVIVVVSGASIFQHAAVLRVAERSVPVVASAPGTAVQKPPDQIVETELPHPFLYSIDVFLPFADLNQKKTWQLDDKGSFFLAYQVLYLLEELAGWVLTALLAAAATGLLKNQ